MRRSQLIFADLFSLQLDRDDSQGLIGLSRSFDRCGKLDILSNALLLALRNKELRTAGNLRRERFLLALYDINIGYQRFVDLRSYGFIVGKPQLSIAFAPSNRSLLLSAPITTAIRSVSSLDAVAEMQQPAFEVVPVFSPVAPS